MTKTFEIESLRFHRNGVCGQPYYHANLRLLDGTHLTATVFTDEDTDAAAILDDDGCSYRYEDFIDELRKFIKSKKGQALAFVPHPKIKAAVDAKIKAIEAGTKQGKVL